MFQCGSPNKRKNDESIADNLSNLNDELPSCSNKKPRQELFPSKSHTEDVLRLEKIREIIKQEFTREIKSKEMQLEKIDERLEEANRLLNRLRYAIVAEYYTKQEQPQIMIEATKTSQNIETSSCDKVPQIAIHPSLKKIIGKKPANFEEIMKVHPKRTVAQNSNKIMHNKTTEERREERRLQKCIREQGIVIDHSKINVKQTPLVTLVDLKANSTKVENYLNNSPHALNASRSGNKSKFYFVVGNTSKYIGNGDSQIHGHLSFTHKWLVYVQTKETDVPIETYMKKVRFFLHPSYRPNDIVDVHAPPFQVARRGWGEFPIRIQLFFHDKFQQKPIQLIHSVVLDTAKTGRHTLGSETVMEVWLRSETSVDRSIEHLLQSPQSKHIKPFSPAEATTTVSSTPVASTCQSRKISFTHIKEAVDDNFLDFLNKIDETRTSICADIEKIQPTVVVNEHLEAKLSYLNQSPNINKTLRSPIKGAPTQLSPYRTRTESIANNSLKTKSPTLPISIKGATMKLKETINKAEPVTNSLEKTSVIHFEDQGNIVKSTNATKTAFVTSTVTTSLTDSQKIVTLGVESASPSGKAFSNISGTVILPVTNPQQSTQQKGQTNLVANSVFQKKIVKIIDAQGNVKTIQMLVAPSKIFPSNTSIQGSSTKCIADQAIPGTKDTLGNLSSNVFKPNLVTTKSLIMKQASNSTTSSNIVPVKPNTSTITTVDNPIPSQEIDNNKTTNLNNFNVVSMPASSSSSKNVVFQKEGKLYIIDPLQVKLKQQQKNQVSLLKPQIKQQNNQQQQKSNIITTIPTDHDYVPISKILSKGSEAGTSSTSKNTEASNNLLHIMPQFPLSKRTTLINVVKTQDIQKLRRIQFEKRFYRLSFSSMRSAIEYLLRRLPLIVFDKESPAAAFPFAYTAPQNFDSLPAFKQRSCEWLRAKFIARLIRNIESLKQLNIAKTDTFWSTREIIKFARYYGYTPPIKPLLMATGVAGATGKIIDSKKQFSTLIKNEMKSEELQLEYDTLSPMSSLQKWLDSMKKPLQQYQNFINEEEVIIIENDSDNDTNLLSIDKHKTKAEIAKRIYGSPLKLENSNSKASYLPPLARLETAFQFVGEICKDLSVRLQPEEIVPGIVHPLAQTLLAHTLKVFVDRLLRQSVANQKTQQQSSSSGVDNVPENTIVRCITVQDVRKAVIENENLDFLTNRYLGVSNKQIKPE